MATIDIKITNLPQIRAAFGRAPQLMIAELNKAIFQTLQTIRGKEILEYRALGIRVITGGLINSISRGVYQADLKGEVGPNVTGSPGVDYALYVHSGTRYMKARPFLLNAVNSSQTETDKFFTSAVDKVLSQIGKAT